MTEEKFMEFPIEDYKDRYKVSNKGRIWSNRKQYYLNTIISNGNKIFFVNKPGSKNTEQFRVDIIVATSFLGNSDLYLEHIDGDIYNNDVSNLRWISIPEYLKEKYGYAWKMIKGYENYFISSNGRIWTSYNDHLIEQQIVSGYNSVNIGYPNQLFSHVHRLVGIAFLENPNNHPVINHKDGNKFNNNISNLEWVTHSENQLHSINVLNNRPAHNNINEMCDEPIDSIELKSFPNYLITKDGTVYSKFAGRFLNLQINDNGYYRVYFTINKKGSFHYVHRLVAFAYLSDTRKEGYQVNHKNSNRLDNRLENLEWVSASENNKHSKENNPTQYKHLQKKVARLDKDTKKIISIYDGIKSASRETGVNSGSIVKVCKGVRLSAGNFIWKYVTD